MKNLQSLIVGNAPRSVIGFLSRLKSRLRRARSARKFRPLIDQLFPSMTRRELLDASDDGAVFRLITEQGRGTILKLATSSASREQLAGDSRALQELAALADLGEWRSHIASLLEVGEHEAGTWFTQSMIAGDPTSEVDVDAVRLVAAATAALRPLHRLTSQVVLSDEVLDDLVSEPLATIEQWRPSLAAGLARIDASMRTRLQGRELTLCRQHGDFGPTNVLWKDDRVSGIVDWKFSAELLPPEVDLVHYALSLVTHRRRTEYGDTVLWLLGAGAGSPEASWVRVATDAGPNGFDLGVGVTIAWLQHVSFGLQRVIDQRTNRIWLVNNLDRVVDGLRADC